MIREKLGHDDEKIMYRLSLTPREVAAAVTATGLPADAFAGTWDAWCMTARPVAWVLVEHRPSREPAALDWVQEHLDDLPVDWSASVGGEDMVDEFYNAGHLAERNEHGDIYGDWRDENGEHVGLVCETCGYRQCSTCERLDDVPDCDGPAGKVRRLTERRAIAMRTVKDLDLAIFRAEQAADPVGVAAQARSSHYEFWTAPDIIKDIAALVRLQADISGLALIVKTKRGVTTRHSGDVSGFGTSLRYLVDDIEVGVPKSLRVRTLVSFYFGDIDGFDAMIALGHADEAGLLAELFDKLHLTPREHGDE